jgi:endonuclease-3
MKQNIIVTIQILQKHYPTLALKEFTHGDPFKTLITTVLSQRARDPMTIQVADRLFREVGERPQDFIPLSLSRLEHLIYQSGTYTQKAKHIKSIVSILVGQYKGKVPNTLDSLLALPGVGRKTANIVLNNCFNIPAIAVDTHVHRISNRLGWVKTTTPEKTEFALMQCIPKKYWKVLNHILVRHGQEICKPIHPQCDRCPVRQYCVFYKTTRTKTKEK